MEPKKPDIKPTAPITAPAIASPPAAAAGEFWVWDGGDGITLSDASWGPINGDAVNDGDQLLFDGSVFAVIPGGGGGIVTVNGTAPIQVDTTTNPAEPNVSIDPATDITAGSMSATDKAKLDGIADGAEVNEATNLSVGTVTTTSMEIESSTGQSATLPSANNTQAGLMSQADKAALDDLVSNGSGVMVISAGDGVNVVDGATDNPIISANFGVTPNGTPTEVMPYDISMLGVLT